ncbi:hypothetical protein DY000_02058240 [Brassica cretica]|uniref:Uncharacterized protein n=1 Tax=Brassica cretica TaxID=69181 RepID=A0ABQ7AAA2_BRACR|nr:hypothetical protein DY000_02058240 [Brassica cretica]
MATVGRNIAAPLLFLNLVMYLIVLGFASFGGNGATPFFLTFSILAAVIGIASKLAGGNHIRFWRNDSLAAAGSASIVAWAVTALAMGLACKQINIGGWRGWRLRMIEAFIIILTFTQLLYLLLIHAGTFSSKYGPGYRDTDYATGQGHHVPGTHAGEHKAGVGTHMPV